MLPPARGVCVLALHSALCLVGSTPVCDHGLPFFSVCIEQMQGRGFYLK